MNPKVVAAPGARAPFHATLPNDTRLFAYDVVAFQASTAPGHPNETFQPADVAEPVFLSVASTLRPVPHSSVFFSDTVTPPFGIVVGEAVGDALVGDADGDAEAVGDADGEALGEAELTVTSLQA